MQVGEQKRLSCALLTALTEEVFEVVVDDGIELSLENFREIMAFFDSFGYKTAALVNKKNRYTLGFDFQQAMGDSKHLIATAIVERDNNTAQINRLVLGAPRPHHFNARQFFDYNNALTWLKEQLQAIK